MMAARNEAEQHFETYLDGHGLAYEYELATDDGKRPDYWIRSG
jgi:hypothetical protein